GPYPSSETVEIGVGETVAPGTANAEMVGFAIRRDPAHYCRPPCHLGVGDRPLHLDHDVVAWGELFRHDELKTALRNIHQRNPHARRERSVDGDVRGTAASASARECPGLKKRLGDIRAWIYRLGHVLAPPKSVRIVVGRAGIAVRPAPSALVAFLAPNPFDSDIPSGVHKTVLVNRRRGICFAAS